MGNAAAVVIDNASGDVLALVGSGDYFGRGRPSQRRLGATLGGLTFKPFTYLLAFERGATPATVVADVPSEFVTATGLFAPVNYDRRCYGPMRCRLALANSLNIAAVKVLAGAGGPEALEQRLRLCGLTTLTRPADEYRTGTDDWQRRGPAPGVGECICLPGAPGAIPALSPGAGTRPRDLPSKTLGRDARATARGRRRRRLLDCRHPQRQRRPPPGLRPRLALAVRLPRGLQDRHQLDFRDNWAFGYTPEYTVGVWAGNFDGAPMEQVSGVTGAAPILHDLFETCTGAMERPGTRRHQAS